MSIVDKAYKHVYSSKTPTTRVVGESINDIFNYDEAEINWIILGKKPVSAEEIGG